MSEAPRYDAIGRSYVRTRAEDPRIAAAIWDAFGDAASVVNVGAGTGHYEPRDGRRVVAVEPSPVMRAQRAPDAAPVVDARAEALPFADGEFDAAMAVFADHHWEDRAGGLRELRRVAGRAIVLNWNPASRRRTRSTVGAPPRTMSSEVPPASPRCSTIRRPPSASPSAIRATTIGTRPE